MALHFREIPLKHIHSNVTGWNFCLNPGILVVRNIRQCLVELFSSLPSKCPSPVLACHTVLTDGCYFVQPLSIFRFWWLSLCHRVTEGVDKHVFCVQLEMSLTVCLQDISRFQFGSFLEVVLEIGNSQLVLFIQISFLPNRYFMVCSISLGIQSLEWKELCVCG